jgi:methylglyoxal synthase
MIKNLAIVAHDNCKKELLDWVKIHQDILVAHNLIATGTTGGLIERLLLEHEKEQSVNKLKSGPLGGDQQLGAAIAEGKIDILIFFWDTMQAQPHDVDVKALLRLAVLYNVPTACNRSTADFLISSPLFEEEYVIKQDDFSTYTKREIR